MQVFDNLFDSVTNIFTNKLSDKKDSVDSLRELISIALSSEIIQLSIEEDINSVTEILRHHKLTQGNQVNLFEKEIADYVGAKYAVAVSNWTVGLHMACKSIDLKKGDKFITSPITFLASSISS